MSPPSARRGLAQKDVCASRAVCKVLQGPTGRPGLTEEEKEDKLQAMVDAEDTVGANEITETPEW